MILNAAPARAPTAHWASISGTFAPVLQHVTATAAPPIDDDDDDDDDGQNDDNIDVVDVAVDE